MAGPIPVRILGVVLVATSALVGCASPGPSPARSQWEATYEEQDRHAATTTGDFDAAPVTHEAAPVEGLEALLDVAERHNPGLRAAFDRWTAALEQVPQARSLPAPRFSYAYFIESVETRVGPQRQRFGVAQSIPLFGKLGLGGDIALQSANVAGAHFEQARLQLRFELTRLWSEYYHLGRAIEVTEENMRLLTDLERVALAQYTTGRTPHASVMRAQVELGRLEDRLRTLRDQQRPLLAALNAELDRAPDAAIALPDTLVYEPDPRSQSPVADTLLADNPRLAALRFQVEKEKAAATLAGRSSIPDLTLGAEYIDTDEARMPVADSGKDAAIATASITIPLWFGQYKAAKAQAVARQSAAERELGQLRNRLLAELERVQFEIRDADRRVELYAYSLLPKARQSVAVAQDAFTAGEVGFLDLVDAQRTLLEFELAYERALADRVTKHALFETLVGPMPTDDATRRSDG